MDQDKYEILLSELAAVIKQKNDEIILKDYQIESLKKKLEAAEQSVLVDGKPKIEKR